jgi:hypothetical protein
MNIRLDHSPKIGETGRQDPAGVLVESPANRELRGWSKRLTTRRAAILETSCCGIISSIADSGRLAMRAVLAIWAVSLAFSQTYAQQSSRQTAQEAYRSRYMVAGFFLRAGNACESDGKELVTAAFSFLGSDEIKAVSKAFPKVTEAWMTEGANGFNSTVMQDGIKHACASALENLRQIQQKDEQLRSSNLPKTNTPKLESTARSVDPQIDKCRSIRRQDFNQWAPRVRKEYQENCWQRIEADNGAVFRIDLGLIQEIGGEATTAIYKDEGNSFNPLNLTRWFFSCEGHFRTLLDNGSLSPSSYAPPRSVAAQMSNIICMGAGITPHGR